MKSEAYKVTLPSLAALLVFFAYLVLPLLH
jgi:hypothetical protein